MTSSPSRPLPVCLPPQPDELLSSWIGRNAAFYDVPPVFLLQHAAPEATSIHAAYHFLTKGQARSLAAAFRTSPKAVVGMTFATVPRATRPLISARPVHSCRACAKPDGAAEAVTHGQLQGCRITCSTCGGRLEDLQQRVDVSTFERHAVAAALVGQGLMTPRRGCGNGSGCRQHWSRGCFLRGVLFVGHRSMATIAAPASRASSSPSSTASPWKKPATSRKQDASSYLFTCARPCSPASRSS